MPLDANYASTLSQKLQKLLKKGRSLSPKHVHQLRTSIRRVEAAADALLDQPKKKDRVLLKDAKRIRRQAGKVRDMDVLTAYTMSIRLAKQHQEDLVPLLEYLGSHRYREAKRLRKIIKKNGTALRKHLKRFSANLRRSLKSRRSVSGDAIPETVGTSVQLISELKQPSRLTRLNLHPYRLKVKKLRDVLRLSGNANHSKVASLLSSVKDAIGEWHDWETLASLADRLPGKPSLDLSNAITRIRQRKYADAVTLAERMKRQVLGSKSRVLSESAVRISAAMAS